MYAEPRLTLKKQQILSQIMAKFSVNFDNDFFTNYRDNELTQPVCSCSNLTIETLDQDVYVFNEGIRTTWTYFTPAASVFTVNFEQLNASWEDWIISVIIKVWLRSIFVPEYHHDIIRSQRTVTYTLDLGLKNSTLILVNLLLYFWNKISKIKICLFLSRKTFFYVMPLRVLSKNCWHQKKWWGLVPNINMSWEVESWVILIFPKYL